MNWTRSSTRSSTRFPHPNLAFVRRSRSRRTSFHTFGSGITPSTSRSIFEQSARSTIFKTSATHYIFSIWSWKYGEYQNSPETTNLDKSPLPAPTPTPERTLDRYTTRIPIANCNPCSCSNPSNYLDPLPPLFHHLHQPRTTNFQKKWYDSSNSK